MPSLSRIYHRVVRYLSDTKISNIRLLVDIHNKISRVIIKYQNTGGAENIKYGESQLLVDTNDHIGKKLYSTGSYEKETKRVIEQLLSRGDVAIDIGAHIGHHTVTMREIVGGEGVVISIEPHPKNSRNIKKTVNKNSWDNVRVIESAVSNQETTQKLVENPGNTGGSTLQNRPLEHYPEIQSKGKEYDVEVQLLTDILNEEDINQIDLIKMDIEGGEYGVLLDIEDMLCDVSYIILEIYTILSNNGAIEFLNREEKVTRDNINHGDQIIWKSN